MNAPSAHHAVINRRGRGGARRPGEDRASLARAHDRVASHSGHSDPFFVASQTPREARVTWLTEISCCPRKQLRRMCIQCESLEFLRDAYMHASACASADLMISCKHCGSEGIGLRLEACTKRLAQAEPTGPCWGRTFAGDSCCSCSTCPESAVHACHPLPGKPRP